MCVGEKKKIERERKKERLRHTATHHQALRLWGNEILVSCVLCLVSCILYLVAQVECLVELATDPNILGRAWTGWAPYI